jgi:hypothetical protein
MELRLCENEADARGDAGRDAGRDTGVTWADCSRRQIEIRRTQHQLQGEGGQKKRRPISGDFGTFSGTFSRRFIRVDSATMGEIICPNSGGMEGKGRLSINAVLALAGDDPEPRGTHDENTRREHTTRTHTRTHDENTRREHTTRTHDENTRREHTRDMAARETHRDAHGTRNHSGTGCANGGHRRTKGKGGLTDSRLSQQSGSLPFNNTNAGQCLLKGKRIKLPVIDIRS